MLSGSCCDSRSGDAFECEQDLADGEKCVCKTTGAKLGACKKEKDIQSAGTDKMWCQ